MDKKQFIYGIRPVIEAISAGKNMHTVLIQKGLKGDLFFKLRELLLQRKIPYREVPVQRLDKFRNKNHQGVVAMVSPISYHSIENILPSIFERGETPLLLILDSITDVRNFGAIARTAMCAGVHAVIVPSHGTAQIGSDAVKTSAGALHNIIVCRERNLKECMLFLKHSGVQVIACTEKANNHLYTLDLTLPVAFILGSEDVGIYPENLKMADHLVRIPVEGSIESLNVSVSAGVVIYEAQRQRKFSSLPGKN